MNRYLTIYFLLFMLLVMGAFASMAQNNYGFAMLGWVSLGFTLVFLVQLARKLTGKRAYSNSSVAELLGLIVLTFLFSMDNFHVRIPLTDYLAAAAALVLAVVYAGNLRNTLQRQATDGRFNRAWIIAYYAGVILFLLSFAMAPFLSQWGSLMNGVAFSLLIIFVIGAFLVPGLRKGWGNNHALQIINTFRDRSFILACLFFLMAMYGSAVSVGWLPPLYSDAYPKVFFDMTGHQEPGSVNASRPQVSQNEFKEKYGRFVERNLEQQR